VRLLTNWIARGGDQQNCTEAGENAKAYVRIGQWCGAHESHKGQLEAYVRSRPKFQIFEHMYFMDAP